MTTNLPKKFAVIGHPIGHSLSPLMHNTAFRLLSLNYDYEKLDIEPDSLTNAVNLFRESNWGGFNVTVPHKESIMKLLDEISPEAKSIGAVNTVVNKNSKLIGYNTDVIGVELAMQPFRERISGKKCMIIGSGGAARSVTYVLVKKFNVKSIVIAAQLLEQAENLVSNFKSGKVEFHVIPSSEVAIGAFIKECALIVNATSVGMHPNIEASPLTNKDFILGNQIVFDVIYRPIKTRLLNDALEKGATIIGGLDMFIQQGAAAFKLWTGQEMPITQIKTVLEKELAN